MKHALAFLAVAVLATGCTTSANLGNPTGETCEERREERRSQRDRGILNAQDQTELRLDGC